MGVPVSNITPFGVLSVPAVVRLAPELLRNRSPAGIVPEIPHDNGWASVPIVPIAMGPSWAPTLPLTPVAAPDDTESVVAPASECSAPRDAAVATAARSTAPTGEARVISPAVDATRRTGVRCKSAIRNAPGRWSQCRRRMNVGEKFMVSEVEERKRKRRRPQRLAKERVERNRLVTPPHSRCGAG